MFLRMMRFAPKVSVVLPVYNPGEGIARCLESLRGQTLREIELIFVDDRGSDGAMELVRAAAEEDGRIRILTQPENMGAGPARNAGIEAARGEYVSFVDPDDFVAPDFLELLYTKARADGLDIVKGSAVTFHEGDDPSALAPSTKARDFIKHRLAEGKPLYLAFSWEHWTGLYRRKMLMKSGARYGTSGNAQDTTFLLRATYAARTFALEERALYYYVMREGSAVHVYNRRRLDNQLCALHEQLDCLCGRPLDEYVYEYAHGRIVSTLNLQIRASVLPGLEEEAARFLKEVRSEVLRLPFLHELTLRYFGIQALADFGACLPPLQAFYTWENAVYDVYEKILENWVDFAIAHPELRMRCQWGLDRVIAGALEFFTLEMAQKGPSKELDAFYRKISSERARLQDGKK